MPIYEYYCPANNKIYQFYAKTLAQGRTVPRCPDNPKLKLDKIVSRFAVTGRSGAEGGSQEAMNLKGGAAGGGDPAEDARMEAAMGVMEREFSNVDENDPKAMGRMMRRMTELSGEKIPDSLVDQMGGEEAANGGGMGDEFGGGSGEGSPAKNPKEPRQRFKARLGPPVRDPKLYDYE